MLLPNRRSIRLAGRSGRYFITLCTYRSEPLFGVIDRGRVSLSEAGRIVEREWRRSALIRREVELEPFVIMPTHVHALVIHAGTDRTPARSRPRSPRIRCAGPSPRSLGALVAGFKSAVTRDVNRLRDTPGARVWHRNYYECIVRDEAAYRRIAAYIARNPQRWPGAQWPTPLR